MHRGVGKGSGACRWCGTPSTAASILPSLGAGLGQRQRVYQPASFWLLSAGENYLHPSLGQFLSASNEAGEQDVGLSYTGSMTEPGHHIRDYSKLGCSLRLSGRELGKQLEEEIDEVYTIGDAAEPRNIASAIYEGSVTARSI